jgi:2-methylisocitrate lyase-like PEP mutase family enzyme
MKKRESFRSLLARHHPLVTPSAHDALSARMVAQAGFKAIAIGGSSMLAAQYALPDVGIASLADMVEGARNIMRGSDLPCGIDADDGYGDARSVVRTVKAYEEIGVGSMIFEDQLMTAKKPGDGHATSVVPAEEMEKKLRAALATRSDPETIILARTDAYKVHGLDEALRRADRYLKAGADGIFVSGLSSIEELERVGRTLRGAIQVAVVTERLLPLWPSPTELYAMGFGQITYPQFLIARMALALQNALAELAEIGEGLKAPAEVTSFASTAERLQDQVGVRTWTEIAAQYA